MGRWWQKALVFAAESAYKAARVTRTNSTWQPTLGSGEEQLRAAADLMMARARDLSINSPAAKRIADTLADLMIGRGLQSYAVPFTDDLIQLMYSEAPLRDRIMLDLEYSLESDAFFEQWCEHADADGDNTWHELERMACYELVNAGNAILLRCDIADPERPISLCYQLIERDQLDTMQDRPASTGENKILNGIEYDGRNRKVAYWIHDSHPSSTYDYRVSGGSSRIPANRIIHAYLRFRPSQRSGYPWAQEAYQAIRDCDWYLGSELTSAAIQSILTFIHKSPNHRNLTGLEDGLDSEDEYGNSLLKLGAGVVFRGGLDDELEIAESKRPSRDAAPFIQQIRVEEGMGAGISPVRLTRDYRTHSYTSARAAHLDDDAHIKPLQEFFSQRISLPIRRAVNREAAAQGKLASVTPRQFRADLARYQKFEILGPGREQLDPEKETEASISKLRAGISNLQMENGRRQQHWVRVLLQRAIEDQVAGALGVTLDFSKGGGNVHHGAGIESAPSKSEIGADDGTDDGQDATEQQDADEA